jgi:hypothetical protein
VQVYALDPSRGYYFIENPSQKGTYCWVWGFYATPVNSFVGIPVYTPAYTPTLAQTYTPSMTRTATGTLTPTPGFTLTNQHVRDCSGRYLEVTVTNTGTTIFRSGSVTIVDTTDAAGNVPANASNDFVDYKTDCTVNYAQGDLITGEKGNLSSGVFPAGLLPGHHLNVTVRVCSLDGMAGTCVEKSFAFTN